MDITTAQFGFFLSFFATVGLYCIAEYLFWKVPKHEHQDGDKESAVDAKIEEVKVETQPLLGAPEKGLLASIQSSAFVQCLQLNQQALIQNRLVLRAMVEFGCLMLVYYLCDRTDTFQESKKEYSRDLFVFLFVILTLVAFQASTQKTKAPLLLNRSQTEEWKGWMQVLFLLYHYYEAKEAYNAIRVFIAGYVWMTGYGNFTYYYRTGDFGIGRFCQMMWRLNFLVVFACIVLNNSYMLYYICPMHTIYTVFVYAALAIGSKYNKNNWVIMFKMVFSFILIEILWNKTVFYTMWDPFKGLVGYLDPRKPDMKDYMREWFFRSGLDRYIWIYGMLCAFVHPIATKALNTIESFSPTARITTQSIIVAVTLKVSAIWYYYVYRLPKVEYNQMHPYTSWIPITCFMILRNLTPSLRVYHMRLYGWLGCITLETYISQFHIWLHTDIADGQPKTLLCLLPGYPLLNFTLVTAMYIYISHRFFELTNTLKNAFVPHDDNPVLLRNVIMMFGIGLVVYTGSFAMKGVVFSAMA